MKKILFFITLICLCYIGRSQTAFSHTTTNPTGAVVNTGIDTSSYVLSKSYHVVSVQPALTKVSGTVAGTSILQISLNGTQYINTDTVTNTNVAVSSSVIWTKITAARYFRVITTGSGTMSATTSAKISATP